ncbi:MAG: xanthine dehydrogenase family protein molybdopterin-binding subunit [Actinomycetota bacterium]
MNGSILGHPVKRTEDPRFLTGEARYTEDLEGEGALHAVFVRATLAHATIQDIDVEAARGAPGVVDVFTAESLDLPPQKSSEEGFERPLLARDRVRFVGEPVAIVVGESRAQAVDAAEQVLVDYEPLPAVVDVVKALEEDAPLLFPDKGSNVAAESKVGDEPVDLSDAEVVVKQRMVNPRVAPVPLETNASLAVPEDDRLILYTSCQAPFWVRRDVAKTLGMDRGDVDVVAPAVGGGFGAKIATYPEQILVAALARRLDRPVRFTETRTESMSAMSHGRSQVQDVEIGATREGRIVGLKVTVIGDMGAYPATGSELPPLTQLMLSGVYDIPRIESTALCVVTNTTPIAAYRGAGRPEACALVERSVDMLARELDMDPVELRRRNFIAKDDFPHSTPAGADYDSGDYGRALDEVLAHAGYEELRAEQLRRRESGGTRQLGIGISTYVEVTGLGSEFGAVEVHPDGRITARTGTSPHGQGHETAFAQLVAAKLNVPIDSVEVVHSDTRRLPHGSGTMGSRSLQTGGSALANAGDALVDKARHIAAHALEVGVEDVTTFEDGRIGVAGAPDRALEWAEVARLASEPDRLPEGFEPGLSGEDDFDPGANTFPFGAHLAVVEVDVETGLVDLVRHVTVDDCGRVLNPLLVQGQQHGGIAQGAGQALFEEVVFDEEGNPLSTNLGMYRMVSPAELCSFETSNIETPTPLNPLGAKGIGESATIGSTPAIQNAVVDALAHLGIRHVDMPLTPERVWSALRQTGG